MTFMSCSEDENDHIVYGVGAIALDKTEVTLTVGGTPVELEATLLPDNVTHKDVVMWTTSDSTVAIVSGDVEVRTVVEEPSEDVVLENLCFLCHGCRSLGVSVSGCF